MPEEILETNLSEKEKEVLERVQKIKGLSSLDEAARYLMKRRLRNAAMKATGRNRAVYLVGADQK